MGIALTYRLSEADFELAWALHRGSWEPPRYEKGRDHPFARHPGYKEGLRKRMVEGVPLRYLSKSAADRAWVRDTAHALYREIFACQYAHR